MGQSQSRGPAVRAGQIRRNYLLLYENFPAHSSFSIFLQTLTYAVIITSYHQLHISSNTNICSHHYLLPPVLGQRSPRSSQSPHYCPNWGQYRNIPAHGHKMDNDSTPQSPRILYPGMNGIRKYTDLLLMTSGRRPVPVNHVEANTTTEQDTQTTESDTVSQHSQVNTSQNHTDSPN